MFHMKQKQKKGRKTMRKEMRVNRIVTFYEAECVIVNLDTNATETKTITTVKNTDKERQSQLNENEKLVYTATVKTVEKRYSMSLTKFCEIAEEVKETEEANEN